MATITINVKDDINQAFRKTAEKKLGRGKGTLGRAVEEAMKNWVEEEEQEYVAQRQIRRIREGLYSLKGWKFKREEAYER